MIGWLDALVIFLVFMGILIPTIFGMKAVNRKRKFPFKIIMHVRRNYGWIINPGLRGGIIKDEKGISMFRVPHKKGHYETRELPPSDIISADGTIHMARIGETIVYLNPKVHLSVRNDPKTGEERIDMDNNADGKTDFTLVPVTTQTKYSTLYELKRATQLAQAGKFDWKPIMAYGGLVLLFIGVIVVTYMIWEKIDLGAISELTKTNAEIARTNLEIVDKLRTINIGG